MHQFGSRQPNFDHDNLTEEERRRSRVFVGMPRGFTEPGKVLKLKKSLYGLKQAPRNFFLRLKSKLEAFGFQSQEDLAACWFISDKVICLVYIDDMLFYAPKMEYIDKVIEQLREQGMDLEVEGEGEVSGFLVLHVEQNVVKGTISLT
jgi:Reverse transcriptase (RNA-dependent DNA polymerase)